MVVLRLSLRGRVAVRCDAIFDCIQGGELYCLWVNVSSVASTKCRRLGNQF